MWDLKVLAVLNGQAVSGRPFPSGPFTVNIEITKDGQPFEQNRLENVANGDIQVTIDPDKK